MTSTPRSSQKRRAWPLLLLLLAPIFPQPVCAAPNTALDALPTTLLVDNSVPVLVGGEWVWVPEDAPELHRRQDKSDKDKDKDDDEEASALATATEDDPEPTRTGDGKGSGTASATKSAETSPLPSPFDNNLDFNFTSNGGKSCPRFLNELLTSEEFKECYPISMVLQTSRSFFDATKELQAITTILDAACAAPLQHCATYLASQAAALVSPSHCAQEYTTHQRDVRRIHLGLTSYSVLYKATCLRRKPSDAYCFADAVTNATTPANAYVYFLPLNMTMPGGAEMDCGGCLGDTMAIYRDAAARRSLPVASTYEGAARRVNEVCGGGFADETLPEAMEEDAAGSVRVPGAVMGTAVAVVILSWML